MVANGLTEDDRTYVKLLKYVARNMTGTPADFINAPLVHAMRKVKKLEEKIQRRERKAKKAAQAAENMRALGVQQ